MKSITIVLELADAFMIQTATTESGAMVLSGAALTIMSGIVKNTIAILLVLVLVAFLGLMFYQFVILLRIVVGVVT